MDLYLLKFPFRRFLSPLLKKLGWLHPDVVSYTAVVVALATGWCFYEASSQPALLLVAIILIFVRMTLNTLDGILAIQRDQLSLKGEIVNALPDRYSDIFLFGGIALSPLCRPWLGLAAMATVFLVSYTGMMGKALTVSWQHQGPMGKVERFFTVMVFALLQFLILPGRQSLSLLSLQATPLEWAMGLVVVLGQYTVLRRLAGQLKEIHAKEAVVVTQPEKAIVIYDSASGNTRRVAEQIARGLGCRARPVGESPGIEGYRLVVLGSPNIRKHPSRTMQSYQSRTPARPGALAVFSTYGLPVWGRLTAGNCERDLARAWGLDPVAQFTCPGYHHKYKTYKRRPNQTDLLDAYLFGCRLSRQLASFETGVRT